MEEDEIEEEEIRRAMKRMKVKKVFSIDGIPMEECRESGIEVFGGDIETSIEGRNYTKRLTGTDEETNIIVPL